MKSTAHYHRHFGAFSATMLIAGSMIGSGIFIVPAEMLRLGGSGTFLLAAWGLTALLTLLGAHTYGELAGMFPEAGGPFVYLKNAYGPLVGFLYGWSMFAIIETGCIAAVAVAFGKFLPFAGEARYLLGPLEVPAFEALPGILLGPYHLGLTPARLAAILVILTLSALNARGSRQGALLQNVVTVAKLGSLAAVVAIGLLAAVPPQGSPVPAVSDVAPALPFLAALLVAQSGSLFSADAWNSVTFIAAEVRDPRRTIPLALLVGPALVLGLYALANVVYLRVLGPANIASAPGDRVGTAALQALLGPSGATFMTAAVLVSTFGCANGVILAGSRLYQSMAAAGLFFPAAARLNRHGVPGAALAIQAFWACLLTLTGSFNQLVEFSISTALVFYLLTVAGVFVLRRREPGRERPVKIFAYPLPPALYLAGTLAVLGALLRYRPSFTWPGMLLVLLGLPVYFAAFRPGRGRGPC